MQPVFAPNSLLPTCSLLLSSLLFLVGLRIIPVYEFSLLQPDCFAIHFREQEGKSIWSHLTEFQLSLYHFDDKCIYYTVTSKHTVIVLGDFACRAVLTNFFFFFADCCSIFRLGHVQINSKHTSLPDHLQPQRH